MSPERLRAELAAADAELRAHMASWEYAFAMGGGRDGGREHPAHGPRAPDGGARRTLSGRFRRGSPNTS